MAKIGMFFPKSEYARRLKSVRQAMTARRLDAILVSCPENIYYLSGLDHMGYFAYQMLVVPLDGTPILITRAMERATVQDQAPGLKHVGYSDAQIPETKATAIAGHDPEGAAPEEAIGGSDPWMQPQGMPVRSLGSRRVQPYGTAPVRFTIQAIEDAGLNTKRLGLEMA
ncbi:MAG: aminopeptidase P family N-terminal domain-containing protein, partial [Planctomycetes bacterium]|nr:aminopeptidase P family N-terminal domain-containing protein [Planctomycetota bacterium]